MSISGLLVVSAQVGIRIVIQILPHCPRRYNILFNACTASSVAMVWPCLHNTRNKVAECHLVSAGHVYVRQLRISAGLCKLVDDYKSAVSVPFEVKKAIWWLDESASMVHVNNEYWLYYKRQSSESMYLIPEKAAVELMNLMKSASCS